MSVQNLHPLLKIKQEPLNYHRMEAVAEIQPRFTWLRFVIGRRPLWTFLRIVLWIEMSYYLFAVVLIPVRITGFSMFPTYHDGAVNFINRYSYYKSLPKRGDIVGVEVSQAHLLIVKRIIGIPGDRIAAHDGAFYRDGARLSEPYVKSTFPYRLRPITLGDGEYWVIGDNRAISEFRKVARDQILGKLVF